MHQPLLIELPQTKSTVSKAKKKKRVENDFYPTGDAYTNVMLDALPVGTLSPNDRIIECAAGKRDIVRVLNDRGFHNVHHTDITDGDKFDATKEDYWIDLGEFDWVITNPPFNIATPILQLAFKYARKGVIFLLPISFFEPVDDQDGSNKKKGIPPLYDKSLFAPRHQWLPRNADHQRWQQIVNPRPLFREDSNTTDSKTVCWTLWNKDFSWIDLGVEPPFRYDRGSRSPENSRLTVFPPTSPKLNANTHLRVNSKSPEVETGDELARQAIVAYERELQEIGDCAPIGAHITVADGRDVYRIPTEKGGEHQTQRADEVAEGKHLILNRDRRATILRKLKILGQLHERL